MLFDSGKVAVWKKIYTYCLQKQALPFQPMVKVLKIKVDIWQNKKILHIKPYNLCKNSMWPTKAYIYLYIVHLKLIYNSYSQRKKSSKRDIMSNTAVPSLWVHNVSALSSEENQREGLLLEIWKPTWKSKLFFPTNNKLNFTTGN